MCHGGGSAGQGDDDLGEFMDRKVQSTSLLQQCWWEYGKAVYRGRPHGRTLSQFSFFYFASPEWLDQRGPSPFRDCFSDAPRCPEADCEQRWPLPPPKSRYSWWSVHGGYAPNRPLSEAEAAAAAAAMRGDILRGRGNASSDAGAEPQHDAWFPEPQFDQLPMEDDHLNATRRVAQHREAPHGTLPNAPYRGALVFGGPDNRDGRPLYPSNRWVEVMRNDASGRSGYPWIFKEGSSSCPGCFTRAAPGSGIWLNTGKTLAADPNKYEKYTVLLKRAVAEGYDTVQIPHADACCPRGRNPMLLVTSPACTAPGEMAKDGIRTCLPVETRSGEHSLPCNCDEGSRALNCGR